MTGAFLFCGRVGRPRSDDPPARVVRRRGVRSARHALERQLRLLPQRRAQSGARAGDGGVSHHGRRAGRRVRGLPRAGRRARPPQRRSGAPLRAARDRARRSDDREPVAPLAGARRGRVRPLPRAADRGRRRAVPRPRRSVRRRGRSRALQLAAVARHAARRGSGGVRGPVLGRRHAAPHRLRVPGAAAVGLRDPGRAHLHELPRHARGRPARTASRALRGRRPEQRRDVHRLPHGARRAGRARRARPPRSGGGGGPLRRLPHAPDRLRRARRASQPPHRDPRSGAGRGRRPAGRLLELPRRRASGRRARPARDGVLGRSGRARGRGGRPRTRAGRGGSRGGAAKARGAARGDVRRSLSRRPAPRLAGPRPAARGRRDDARGEACSSNTTRPPRPPERARLVSRLRAQLGVAPPDGAAARAHGAGRHDQDLEIGE